MNDNSLTLNPYAMKLCILSRKQLDGRKTDENGQYCVRGHNYICSFLKMVVGA